MEESDKRKIKRFTMTVPALITVTEGPNEKKPLAVGTRDVSAGGAFFACEEPLQVDTRVEIGMLIPFAGAEGKAGGGAHVKVTGVVVRANTEGMAIEFNDDFQLKPFTS